MNGWKHYQFDPKCEDDAMDFLSKESLPTEAAEILTAPLTRPRFIDLPEGVAIILRAANFNEGFNPEDMISLRIYLSNQGEMVTVASQNLRTIEKLYEDKNRPRGKDLVIAILDGVSQNIAPVMTDIDDALDAQEKTLLADDSITRVPSDLAALRLRVIGFKRFLMPQREVFRGLLDNQDLAFEHKQQMKLRNLYDRVMRDGEFLEAARDRAAILQEELRTRLSERMSMNTYWLSLVATVFLPLSFLTGLFGVNLSGIPYAESPLGFAVLCTAMFAGGLFTFIWLQRKLRL